MSHGEDGASNRNTPERCPRPLYSQDHTEENHSVPQEDQGEVFTNIKEEDIKEEEETYVRGDQQCKEEEIPTAISTDGASNRNTPERCPRPLYSQDDPEENHSVPQEDQVEDLIDIKVEGKEETCVMDDQQCKEQEIPTAISTADGNNDVNTSEGLLVVAPECKIEDYGIAQDSPGENSFTSNIHPIYYESADLSYYLPNPQECSPYNSDIVIHNTVQSGDKVFPCPDCGKCFNQNAKLMRHQLIHTRVRPFPCSDCGKCFTQKSDLVNHHRNHTGEKPFSCSYCGKCFARKSILVDHQRIHSGEKPFSCSVCGKCFTQRTVLVKHQRTHTGEKPFPCFACGRCFTRKSILVAHQRIHTGEKPFPCSECGKCFTQKSLLVRHQKKSHVLAGVVY